MVDERVRRSRAAGGAIYFSLMATIMLIAPKFWGPHPLWQPVVFVIEIGILLLAGWKYYETNYRPKIVVKGSLQLSKDWPIFLWGWFPSLPLIRFLNYVDLSVWEMPVVFLLLGLPFYNSMFKASNRIVNVLIVSGLVAAISLPMAPLFIENRLVAFACGTFLFTSSLLAVLPIQIKPEPQTA